MSIAPVQSSFNLSSFADTVERTSVQDLPVALYTEKPAGEPIRVSCDEIFKNALTLDQMKESMPQLYAIYNDNDPTVKALPEGFEKMVDEYINGGGNVNVHRNFNNSICLTFFTNMMDWHCNTSKMLKKATSELEQLNRTLISDFATREKEEKEKKAQIDLLKKNVEILERVIERLLLVPNDKLDLNPVGFQTRAGNSKALDFWPLGYVIECDHLGFFQKFRKRGAKLPEEGFTTFLWERICTNQALSIATYVVSIENIFAKDYLTKRSFMHFAVDARAPGLITLLHDTALTIFGNYQSTNGLSGLLNQLIRLIVDYAYSEEVFTEKDASGHVPFNSFVTGHTPDEAREKASLEVVLSRGGRGACEQALAEKGELILTDVRYKNVLDALQKFKIIKLHEEAVPDEEVEASAIEPPKTPTFPGITPTSYFVAAISLSRTESHMLRPPPLSGSSSTVIVPSGTPSTRTIMEIAPTLGTTQIRRVVSYASPSRIVPDNFGARMGVVSAAPLPSTTSGMTPSSHSHSVTMNIKPKSKTADPKANNDSKDPKK